MLTCYLPDLGLTRDLKYTIWITRDEIVVYIETQRYWWQFQWIKEQNDDTETDLWSPLYIGIYTVFNKW